MYKQDKTSIISKNKLKRCFLNVNQFHLAVFCNDCCFGEHLLMIFETEWCMCSTFHGWFLMLVHLSWWSSKQLLFAAMSFCWYTLGLGFNSFARFCVQTSNNNNITFIPVGRSFQLMEQLETSWEETWKMTYLSSYKINSSSPFYLQVESIQAPGRESLPKVSLIDLIHFSWLSCVEIRVLNYEGKLVLEFGQVRSG